MNSSEIHLSIKSILILRKINNHPGIDIIKLTDTFGLSAEHYVSRLLELQFIEDRRNRLINKNDPGIYLGCYLITNKGLSFLEDHELLESKNKKEFIIKSILVPIGVSIATSILTYLLVQTLIPTILSLLTSGAS